MAVALVPVLLCARFRRLLCIWMVTLGPHLTFFD